MITKPVDKKAVLTNKMIEVLMDCQYKERLDLEPCSTYTTDIKDLLKRGMLIKFLLVSEGKRSVAFYLTDLAKEYLKKFSCG